MKGFFAHARRILALPGFAGLLASAFVLGVGYSFVSPFLSLWGTQAVGMRPLAFGLFMTVTTLSGIVVATTLAHWSDEHWPRKAVLLLGAAGGMLGYIGYALIRDARVLIVIGCTLIAVATVCFSQLFAFTREKFGSSNLPGLPPGFLTSVVRVCFSISWTAGPSVGALIMVRYGFLGSFLGAAALFALFGIGVLRFVRWEPAKRSVDTTRHPIWRVLTRGHVFAPFAAFVFIFAAHTINMLNLPLMLLGLPGGSTRDVGIAFGIGPAAEIPLMLWFGLLAARGHQLALLRIGGAITILYFLLLSTAQMPWQVFPMQILNGASQAIISNVGIIFFQDLLPGQPGLATAIYTNAANLGNLLGFFSFGALLLPVGHRGLFLASAALSTATSVILVLYRRMRATVPAV